MPASGRATRRQTRRPHRSTPSASSAALAQRRPPRRRCARRGRGAATSISATTAPGRGDITTTRSARSTASSTSWVTSTTVRGSLGEHVREPALHLGAGDRVERGERLVERQHRLARQQRAQERHALAHPARELGRAGCARTRRGRSARATGPTWRAGLVARRPRAPAGRARRCRSRSATAAAGRAGASARPVPPRTVPGVGRLQAADQLEQRRLAAAARADDGDDLAGVARAATCPPERSPRPRVGRERAAHDVDPHAVARRRRSRGSLTGASTIALSLPSRALPHRFEGSAPGAARGRYLSRLPASPPVLSVR